MRPLFLTLFLLGTSICLSQPLMDVAYKSDQHVGGGFLFGNAYSSFIFVDTAYLVSGYTLVDDGSPFLRERGWFCVLDTSGNIIRQKVLGDTLRNMKTTRIKSTVTQDGHYVCTGENDNNSCFVLWLDQYGETIKYHEFYPDSSDAILFWSYDFHLFDDESYLVLAYETDGSKDQQTVIILSDSSGNEIWRKRHSNPNVDRTYGFSILQGRNDEIIIAGVAESGSPSSNNPLYKSQIWIFEIDSIGNKLWEYLSPTSRYLSPSISTVLQNGDIIIPGWEAFVRQDRLPQFFLRYKPFVGRFDMAKKELVWGTSIGKAWFSTFTMCAEKDNGDILAWGNGRIEIPGDTLFSIGQLATFSPFGDSLASQPILHYWEQQPDSFYKQAYYTSKIEILPDKSIMLAGVVEDLDRNSENYGVWAWLVRTDSNGCQNPDCFTVGIEKQPETGVRLGTFPNPVTTWMTLYAAAPLSHPASIKLWNLNGQFVGEQKAQAGEQEWHWDMFELSAGIYVIEMEINGQRWAQKVIKR
ncbi:MAG: T9SS type A sorting domain-containing protein [Bacteroidota bacterium]